MAIGAFLLMTFGMPFQVSALPSTPDPSDSVRAAVSKAALEHAISAAQEMASVTDPDRMFLNLAGPATGRFDRSEWADSTALVAVAEERGLDVRYADMPEHPAYRTCQDARQSAACRSFSGVTFVGVGRVEALGPGRADARISILVIGALDRSSGPVNTSRSETLHLEKVGDAWEVVGFSQRMFSHGPAGGARPR